MDRIRLLKYEKQIGEKKTENNDINKKYHELSLRFHSDRGGLKAAMRDLADAYKRCKDENDCQDFNFLYENFKNEKDNRIIKKDIAV